MGKFLKRIYYHDTDCGGVVYYANYLKYLEEARTEYMRNRGIDLKETASKGVLFAVRHLEANYRAPARYGDQIEIFTEISKLKNASFEFSQEIKRKDTILVSVKTTLVCLDGNFRPQIIPEEIINKLKP